MTEKSPKRRRWLQFRLRTLLIAVLVLSLPLSWFAVRMDRARRQREAVEVIRRFGGIVYYDWHMYRRNQAPSPAWLRTQLGLDFLHDVSAVKLTDPQVSDAVLECLSGIAGLRGLSLEDTQITNERLQHLQGLGTLERLVLENTQISDAGLEYLKGLTNLEWLFLNGTQVTDAGLEQLKKLRKLEVLELKDTNVTPEGVKKLQETLSNCKITY